MNLDGLLPTPPLSMRVLVWCLPPLKNPPRAPWCSWNKTPSPPHDPKVPAPISSLASPPPSLPFAQSYSRHMDLPADSQITPCPVLPQGLCMSCALCLECSSHLPPSPGEPKPQHPCHFLLVEKEMRVSESGCRRLSEGRSQQRPERRG